MTQVLSTGHTAAHCGASKCPMHSVHFFGSMTNVPFFSEIATFGHSGSQAEQLVHCDPMIFNAILCLLNLVVKGSSLSRPS
jgi:hypothetical protein